MILSALMLGMASAMAAPPSAGVIEGIVVNATDDEKPAGEAKVFLRVQSDGQFVPVAETTTDEKGKFRFDQLPIAEGATYLPGANQDGVHYPGPRVRLTTEQRRVGVKLVVFNAVDEPNPLVIRRHEIVVRPEPGVLHVAESIVVENPSTTCYVGQAAHDGAAPVTLRLAIPEDFDRTTFQKEFFGRRFSLIDGSLVTGVPWPPGRRELHFTYSIANEERQCIWLRPLDLPCDEVRLTVLGAGADEVTSNLPRDPSPSTRKGGVCFASTGTLLPAGHVIRLELRRLPVSMMARARWIALAVLAGLIAGVSLMIVRWNLRVTQRSSTAANPNLRPPIATRP